MSYQVLARKWRPKNFQELRGQEHVSRALVNAIESGRLHHAYLFTGTRGVGKTTIARILSKCLNCETNGITATPCGECGSCSEIDQGRFVDLIEVDAASRTKVDDTRELLENVQYRPTRGRYKVYLIDEVHMLSNSSFNALLKTLEEPPEHVIFLLATTDPQKLPVTVLSRCLQFHLKHMDEETISSHLQFILEQESIDNEAAALGLIAQSAEGSMRDALSLLDQAIAYGHGKVLEDDIRTMLGTIDHKFMVRLLEALASKDSVMAIKAIDDMSHYPVDFADALKELLSRLHQIAIYQATQVSLDHAASYIPQFADIFESEDLQMYYQLGLHARRDLEWAPTAKQGLEMALLRMLAFQIDTDVESSAQSPKKKVNVSSKVTQESASQGASQGASQRVSSIDNKETHSEKFGKAEELPKLKNSEEPIVNNADSEQEPVVEHTVETETSDPAAITEQSESLSPAEDNKKSDSGDDFSGYEQFFQQEDSDREDSQFTVGPESEPASKASPKQEESLATNGSEQSEQGDEDALASLHSALGLSLSSSDDAHTESLKSVDNAKPSFNEEPEIDLKPFSGQGNTQSQQENTSSLDPSDSLPIDAEDSNSGGNSVPESVSKAEDQSYDSDIERLRQAQERSAQEPEPEVEKVNTSHQVVDANKVDEPGEFVEELNVPQQAMDWAILVKELELEGTYHQIAQSSCAKWTTEKTLVLELAPEQEVLLTDGAKANIKEALEAYKECSVEIEWVLQQPSIETPAMIWQHQAKLRLQKACQELNSHAFSQQIQKQFGAKIDRQSVAYLNG